MNQRPRILACFLLLLPFAATAQAPAPAPVSTVLARGVEYRHLRTQSPAGEPWSIHVLEVNRGEKSIELRAVPGRGEDGTMQRELPTVMANRLAASGENVLAVVNGDYDLPAPYLGVSDGLSVTSGQVWTTGKPTWPSFALLKNGEAVFAVPEVTIELTAGKRRVPVAAVNKPFGRAWGEGARAYTAQFRPAIQSSTPFDAAEIHGLSKRLPLKVDNTIRGAVRAIHRGARELELPDDVVVVACRAEGSLAAEGSSCGLRSGDKVKLRVRVRMAGKKGVRHAIGGFPILVENGRRSIVGTPGENLRRRHPRTAVCTNESKIIFVVVDGRQPQLSVGMTLEELADLMVSLGCATAMNTDGGGSSVMAVAVGATLGRPAPDAGGINPPLRIVNSPSDGLERGRGNAWVIIRKR